MRCHQVLELIDRFTKARDSTFGYDPLKKGELSARAFVERREDPITTLDFDGGEHRDTVANGEADQVTRLNMSGALLAIVTKTVAHQAAGRIFERAGIVAHQEAIVMNGGDLNFLLDV